MRNCRTAHPQDVAPEAAPTVCADGSPWPPPVGTPMNRWPKPEHVPVALACPVCGVAVDADAAGAYAEIGSWPYSWPARICRTCAPAIDYGLGASVWLPVVADLIDPADLAAPKVAAWVPWYCHRFGTTAYDEGAPARWAHVDLDAVAGIVRREHEKVGPRRHESGRGCAGCGVAAALAWPRVMNGSVAGLLLPVCADCGDRLDLTGVGERWCDELAARAAGLSSSQMDYVGGMASRAGFRPYLAGGAGADEAWAYLAPGELERFREWVHQEWLPQRMGGLRVAGESPTGFRVGAPSDGSDSSVGVRLALP